MKSFKIEGDFSYIAFSKKSNKKEVLTLIEEKLKEIDLNYYFSKEIIEEIVEKENKFYKNEKE